MSNLSTKYDPTEISPMLITIFDGVQEAVSYLNKGVLPTDVLRLSTQTPHFRDAVMIIMYHEANIENILPNVFLKQLRTIESVSTPEQITLCEFAATAAYLSGRLDIVKECILRVPPEKITSYIKTLYTAVAIKQWQGRDFRNALTMDAKDCIDRWEKVKHMYI